MVIAPRSAFSGRMNLSCRLRRLREAASRPTAALSAGLIGTDLGNLDDYQQQQRPFETADATGRGQRKECQCLYGLGVGSGLRW